jgi:hypothetical protein
MFHDARAVTDGVSTLGRACGADQDRAYRQASARTLVNWKAMFAASRFGMISTFASPLSREPG